VFKVNNADDGGGWFRVKGNIFDSNFWTFEDEPKGD